MAAIFVTGATGYLGGSLVRRLAKEEEVVILARHPERAAPGFPGVRVCRGDVLHLDSLRRALTGCDRIFHCAAHVRVWDREPGRFEAVNVEGLRNVLEAARDAGIRRIIYTSSFIALGPTDGQIADEAWEPQGREFHNEYERTKAMGDRLARREVSQGTPLVILYPGVIYGPGPATPGNLVGRMVSDFIAGRLPGILGSGDRRFCYAFVTDVVEGHLLALRKAKDGARYILGGENRTMREVFAELERLTSLPAPSRRIPFAVAELAGRLQRWRAAISGREPEITDEVVRIYRHEWAYTSRRAEEELGYSITPLARGLAETVAAFRGAREATR